LPPQRGCPLICSSKTCCVPNNSPLYVCVGENASEFGCFWRLLLEAFSPRLGPNPSPLFDSRPLNHLANLSIKPNPVHQLSTFTLGFRNPKSSPCRRLQTYLRGRIPLPFSRDVYHTQISQLLAPFIPVNDSRILCDSCDSEHPERKS